MKYHNRNPKDMTKKEELNEEKIMFGEIDLECELAGYNSTSSLIEHGVSFYQIKKLVEDGRLVKIERGLYASPDSWEDGFQILQHRYSKGIFSGYSAMYLQQMCDFIPPKYYMTFPKGYNTRSLSKETDRLDICRTVPELYSLGVTETMSPYGNRVRTYNRERTLCDILRGKGIDPEFTKQAFRNYLGSPEMDLGRLTDYADALHVRRKVQNYVEVML